jgi:hypothetical protein
MVLELIFWSSKPYRPYSKCFKVYFLNMQFIEETSSIKLTIKREGVSTVCGIRRFGQDYSRSRNER